MIPVWSTACPDWAERLKKGLSIIPAPIYPDQAAHALAIFKQLRIVDAPGSPTFGESCAPWVFDLVAALFGSYDAQTGVRHIKEVFILIPKKNSKSTLAAGIMMTALLLNWRQAAGYTILAPTVEVAANAFNPARDMVRRDDDLDDLCQVQTHIRTITHRVTDTTLKVVAADPNTVSGIKSVGTLIDELWLFGKQYKAEDMLREAIGGLASRPEGFVVYTTTQSNEPPAGVFRQKLQYARDVRDGKIHDPHFLPVIFEHPPEMVESGAHLLMENLAMVNPNLGYSVDEAFLYREYRKAREAGEEAFRGFMSKHANVEIGLALRSDRWAGADFWEQQGRRVSLDDILQRADVVTVGIDGGGLDDLLGMYVTGRDRETREWLGWGHAWVHETAVVRRKSEASRFQDFVACGDMTIVRRVGDETAEVAEYVRRIHEAELLDHIGIDPSGVGQILDSLAEAGIPDESVVGISQGWKLGGAIKTTEHVTVDEVHPVLQAMVDDAVGTIPVPRDGRDYDPDVLQQAVNDAVANIPVPADGKSITPDDVRPMLEQMVKEAVSHIPAPRDGRDYDPEVLKQAVNDAVANIPVPADGKSITPDDVRPMLEQMVKEAVSHIPAPRDGRDYDPEVLKQAVLEAVNALPAPQDGRDATALEVLPAIDDQKSFPRGTYATHLGGLWRAYEKTHGMRGWECLVDGVADIDVSMTDERLFSVVIRQSSGQCTEKTFSLPVMLYRGVFRAGETYHPGDTVTWGGSLWHCNSMTGDKPGEAHSSGWTLAAKRGRDAGGGK
ncbi:terminase large subunit [Escherichia coli]